MVRKVIKIDEEKCVGCGLCVSACHEGAIGLVGKKARLLREDYCDGLGNCLPVCPTGAISFEEREIKSFGGDEKKTGGSERKAGRDEKGTGVCAEQPETLACGCPGTHSRTIERETCVEEESKSGASGRTRLGQWPVQIKLLPSNAACLDGADLLVAADCTAYAYGNFHDEYMKDRITVIGCPKLDEGDYAEKLTDMLTMNDVRSVTVVRMEVPCCGGIERAVMTALANCKKPIPWQKITVSTDGRILYRG